MDPFTELTAAVRIILSVSLRARKAAVRPQARSRLASAITAAAGMSTRSADMLDVIEQEHTRLAQDLGIPPWA